MKVIVVCIWALLFGGAVQAQTFKSGPQGADLVELYTSEGCSSCPPADAWLSSLVDDPRLFRSLFPVAFHVDYWNRLGWPDRFSSARYTERQRTYVQQGHVSQVYTPGLVVNGQEWRGWLQGQSRSALVAWVSQGSDLQPLQVIGGYIEPGL